MEVGGDIFRGGGGWKCVEVGGKLEEGKEIKGKGKKEKKLEKRRYFLDLQR